MRNQKNNTVADGGRDCYRDQSGCGGSECEYAEVPVKNITLRCRHLQSKCCKQVDLLVYNATDCSIMY